MCVCVCVVLLYSYQLGGQGSPLSTTEYLLSSTQLSYNQLSVGTPSEKVKRKEKSRRLCAWAAVMAYIDLPVLVPRGSREVPGTYIQYLASTRHFILPRAGSTTPSVLAAGLQLARVGDVRIIGRTPFSEVRQGSLPGLRVAVKSLRLYSSPEFNPAEVGIVSFHRSPVHAVETILTMYLQRFLKGAWVSSQLSHPNIVPFLGAYSTLSHPFALIYAVMENLDLRRLRLVSVVHTMLVIYLWPMLHFPSSPVSRVR